MQQFVELNDIKYTYEISEKVDDKFDNIHKLRFGGLSIGYTKNTKLNAYECDEGEACIIGLCIDAHGEIEREKIPKTILERFINGSIEEVYNFCDRFAGKYVVILCGTWGGTCLVMRPAH